MKCKDCDIDMTPVEIQHIDYYLCPKCKTITQKPSKKEELIASIKEDPNDKIEWFWAK